MSRRAALPDRYLRHAAVASAILMVAKGAAYVASGSLILLAATLDALVDVVISAVNARIAQAARARPDDRHPFGHGGFEVLSCMVQGALIFAMGMSVGVQAALRLADAPRLVADQPDSLWLGVGVLIVSALAGHGLAAYLARAPRSLSTVADSAHYRGDAALNLTAAAGLVVVAWTGEAIFDIALGGLGGLYLLWTGYQLLRRASQDILHTQADDEAVAALTDHLQRALGGDEGVSLWRARRLGPLLFVEYKLALPADWPLSRVTRRVDQLHTAAHERTPLAEVTFHLATSGPHSE